MAFRDGRQLLLLILNPDNIFRGVIWQSGDAMVVNAIISSSSTQHIQANQVNNMLHTDCKTLGSQIIWIIKHLDHDLSKVYVRV